MKVFPDFLKLALVALSAFLLSGCPSDGGGSGDVSLDNAPTLDDSSEISITMTALNDSNFEAFKAQDLVDTDSRIYFKDPKIKVNGNCVFGVSRVVAFINGTQVSESTPCDKQLHFEWTKTFTSDNPPTGSPYLVELKPANSSDKSFGNLTADKFISFKIMIDTVAPAATSGAYIASSVFTGVLFSVTGDGKTAQISGTTTAPADAYKVKIDNHPEVAVTLNGTAVSFKDTLNEGVQKTYNFVVYDKAGNSSTMESVIASYASQIPVIAYSFDSFGGTTSNASGSLPFHLFLTHGPWDNQVKATNTYFMPDLFGSLTKSPK